MSVLDELMELRRLRTAAGEAADRANEYLARASRGMSAQRATDTGGTGNCPLTDYAPRYGSAAEEYRALKRQADAIWARLEPRVMALPDFDMREVFRLYYNAVQSWEDVRQILKRSDTAVHRMHREGLRWMESMDAG